MQKVFNFTSLFYFFISSYMWMAFKMPMNIVIALVIVILVISGYSIMKGFRISKSVIVLFLVLFAMSVWSIITVSVSYGILTFFYYLPAIIIFMLPINLKRDTLSYITKWFGIILLISLIIFFITRFFGLPSFGIFKLDNNIHYPPYLNYLFFIQRTNIMDLIVYRFNGPFLEPGHLSVVCSLLIFANHYKFKNNRWLYIPLICVILSLSLAGYVIMILGFMMLTIKNVKYIFYSGVVLIGSYLFITQIWNGGDNAINNLIVSRLKFDEDKGIVGNNRTAKITDIYFESNWKKGNLWKGLGEVTDNDSKIRGAGYKIYFLRYGIISALLVLCFYWNLVPRHYNKRYVFSFLIIVILTFMQRAYPWWYSWLLCFTLGCGIPSSFNRIKLNKRIKRYKVQQKACTIQ